MYSLQFKPLPDDALRLKDECYDLHFRKGKRAAHRGEESFRIFIIVVAVVVFIVIIMMPHMPLCTCHMLGTISPKKNKCGRDCGGRLPTERRTQGLRDQDS